MVDVAKGLEGLRRQDGIHAAAVVITKDPLTEYLPIQRKPEAGKPIEDAPVVTQYEMHGVEDLGLLKMDFLGLRNLDIIDDALELIETTTGDVVDIDNVDLDDADTYELLGGRQLDRGVPARVGADARPDAQPRRRTTSRTSPRSSPSTGPGRWRRTCTTTTPTARTAANRSSTSTPTPRSSSPTRTA